MRFVTYFSFCIVLSCYLKSSDALKSNHLGKGDAESRMHPSHFAELPQKKQQEVEDGQFWLDHAQQALKRKLEQDKLTVKSPAKNVIFYLGDGMSVPTVTAARILKGQEVDKLKFGEEGELHMDTFPFSGVSKTFCADLQVAESACTATAYLSGTRGRSGTIGVSPAVLRSDCIAEADPLNRPSSILRWAQEAGKSTGIITTTTITHASPAGTYAHTSNRDWENDQEVVKSDCDPAICIDIAQQLILGETGKNINVILGGGRKSFMNNMTADPENVLDIGLRLDGQDLIQTWLDSKNGTKAVYVTGKDKLFEVDTKEADYLLGLFSYSHIAYFHDQEKNNDPALEDMVQVAIAILSKNPKGFLLFVEGGRIDHAHHEGRANKALWETIEFDKAIKKGDELTEDNDTLIVVTADHAHVMSIAGYPVRGNSILEIADNADGDGLPFTTLNYANGPGPSVWENGARRNISGDDFHNIEYRPPSPIPIGSETHGGDDVQIFSKGPYAHLLSGVQQQSYIPHAISYAACIGPGAHVCTDGSLIGGGSSQIIRSNSFYMFLIVGLFMFRV